MANIDDINRMLAALYRIHGVSAPNAALEELLMSGRLDEAQSMTEQSITAIRQILDSEKGNQTAVLYEPLEGRLSADEYVLPPELVKVHPVVLANICTGNTTDHFAHGGLLLYDDNIGGTGKTEYVLFLAGQAQDKARFVRAKGNAIRESSSPGTVLKQLYLEIEDKAKEEGILYIVFFDEFEKIVNKYAKQHSSIREDRTDSRAGKYSSTKQIREEKETLEVDSVGEELFSTLKDCVSGIEQIRHVFTIAASNQSAYPETLLRRLEPVELCPFGIKEVKFHGDLIPDYGTYNESLPRVLAVLQATHVRLAQGRRNEVISRIGAEVSSLLEELREQYKSPYEEEDLFGASEKERARRDNGYLTILTGYFGYDILKLQEDSSEGRRILRFAGQMDMSYGEPRQRFSFYKSVSDEVTLMRSLTPDKVAKWYKSNPDAFQEYEAAKRYIGQMIFPQLKAWAEHKAKDQGNPK